MLPIASTKQPAGLRGVPTWTAVATCLLGIVVGGIAAGGGGLLPGATDVAPPRSQASAGPSVADEPSKPSPYCNVAGSDMSLPEQARARLSQVVALGDQDKGALKEATSPQVDVVRAALDAGDRETYADFRVLRSTLIVDELEVLSACLSSGSNTCSPGPDIAHLKTVSVNEDRSWDDLLWKWRAFLIHDIEADASCRSL